MTRRGVAARLACPALVIILATVSLIGSTQEIIRTGRPVSTGGPLVQVALLVIAVAALYIVTRVKGYLDESRPPRNAILCSACGNHAAAFDRRCRRCANRLDLLTREGGRPDA
jgi:hypothetical protein